MIEAMLGVESALDWKVAAGVTFALILLVWAYWRAPERRDKP